MFTKRKLYFVRGGQKPKTTKWNQTQADKRTCKNLQEAVQNGALHSLQSTNQEPHVADQVQPGMLQELEVETPSDSLPALVNQVGTSTDTDDEVGPKERPARIKRRQRKQQPERLEIAAQLLSSSEDGALSSALSSSPASSPTASPQPPEHLHLPAEDIEVLEESDSGDNVAKDPGKDKGPPLCDHTDSTVFDVLFTILVLGIRHSLTWAAQVDFLKGFAAIFKKANIPTTKNMYHKFLNIDEVANVKHQIFCNDCGIYLQERKMVKRKRKRKQKEFVTCRNCSKSISVTNPANVFITLPLEAQITKFLADKTFVDNILTYRFKDRQPGILSDIYDGAAYKKLSENGGILSNPFNFSYNVFTDGVKYGRSNKTIWPIYLSINELPYELRSKYLILAGVYVGAKDPNQQAFLPPFVTEANKLSSGGISWFYRGEQVTSFVIPLCFVADSVARYQMLNVQSFHAVYGCTFCYTQSQALTGGQKYVAGEAAPMRTDESWKRDLVEVHRRLNDPAVPLKSKPYQGVKGYSAFLGLKYFSLAHCVVDYMHCVLIGVVKTHMELILHSTRAKMWIGMDKERIAQDHIMKTIDERIEKIQSNSSVVRELRPISNLSIWKASELRSWLLFYSIPCLSGLLKPQYLAHLAMLREATFLLLKKGIPFDNLNNAAKLYSMYTYYFQRYFGEENMLFNVHLLSHIPLCVFNFGPMWGFSCFPFEAENKFLLLMLKSPFSVALQIARKFCIYKNLPNYREKLDLTASTLKLTDDILHYKKYGKSSASNQCILKGAPECYVFTEEDKSRLASLVGSDKFDECFLYDCMVYRRKRYTTESYSCNKDNNDSYAHLSDGQCILIKSIINIPAIKQVFIMAQKIRVNGRTVIKNNDFRVTGFFQITEFLEDIFVSVDKLSTPCFMLEGAYESYIADIPYGCTVE